MTYLYRKNNNSRWWLKSLIVFLLLTFFLLVKFTSLGGFLSSIFLPMFSVGDKMYTLVDDLPESMWSKERLSQEINILREKEKELNFNLMDMSALQFENRELKEALRIMPEQDFLSAFVIARPPQTSFDTLVINRGSSGGIKIGDLVLVSNSTMLGSVVEVNRYSSIVLLNSSPSVYFGANISRTGESIEVFGHGSGNLFSRIPIITDIEVGDIIVINRGDVFSLCIVKDIKEEETSGFKNIFMSLPVNISDIGIVFVLPSSGMEAGGLEPE